MENFYVDFGTESGTKVRLFLTEKTDLDFPLLDLLSKCYINFNLLLYDNLFHYYTLLDSVLHYTKNPITNLFLFLATVILCVPNFILLG